MKWSIRFIAVPIILIAFGICLGLIIKDFPLFKIVWDVKITDIAQNIITLGVGLFVPLLVKKIIEDQKSIKNSLVEEVNAFQKSISNINEVFKAIYQSGALTEKNKEDFTTYFEISDNELNSLEVFLVANCAQKLKKELEAIKKSYHDYWHLLTGSQMTKRSVKKVEETIFHQGNDKFSNLISGIRNIKSKIHTL
jgi:hypothetical protein